MILAFFLQSSKECLLKRLLSLCLLCFIEFHIFIPGLFLPSSINPPGVCSCGCWVQLTMCRGKGLCWPSKSNRGFLTSQSAPLIPNLALGRHFRNYQKSIPNYVLLLFLSLAVTQNSLILSLKLGRNQVWWFMSLIPVLKQLRYIHLLNFSWELGMLPGPRLNGLSTELGDQPRMWIFFLESL
jgi:hypothetical protein